ncbi:MAG: glycine cleavage system protein GcvH [Nitrospinae bacterium]|nr:glycine cleavage system protein GcvH [Nitrospinota bacterium]
MDFPKDRKYTKDHEWIKVEGGVGTVGITDFAQHELGDIVFVELPQVGRTLAAGEAFGVAESVKTVSDLYAPAAGEVVEVNTALENDSAQVNKSPYGAGWMIKIKVADEASLGKLLSADAYEASLKGGH